MYNYRCVVSYDGSAFNGWQSQRQNNSVQEKIEKHLSAIFKIPIHINGSGRTDKGVHALGQVFNFRCEQWIACDSLKYALNHRLKPDIQILTIDLQEEMFHARHDARSKTYRYLLNMGPYNLFEQRYVYQYNRSLDVVKMQEASRQLLGKHDFTAFNATPLLEIENQVREIYKIEIKQQNDYVIFEFNGNGFLRYMVRMLVATLVKIGEHKIDELKLVEIMNSKNKNAINYLIDSVGLYLVEVEYDEKNMD